MPQNLTNESGEIDNVDELNNYFGDLSLWNQKQKNYTASIFQNSNHMNYNNQINSNINTNKSSNISNNNNNIINNNTIQINNLNVNNNNKINIQNQSNFYSIINNNNKENNNNNNNININNNINNINKNQNNEFEDLQDDQMKIPQYQMKYSMNQFSPNSQQQQINISKNSIFQINQSHSNYDRLPLEEIIQNCYTICKNQTGCRFLQRKIDENPKISSELIYPVISNKIRELTLDSFGNYFIQKIIEKLTTNQINEILNNQISENFLEICLNPHGTRVIQKLLERIYNNQYLLNIFNNLLIPNLLEIVLNPNSTHIIIKYISLVKYPKNETVVNFIKQNLFSVATHKHSCCTLQKVIESVDPNQKKILLISLAQISNMLFNDQYGNYAAQFALSLDDKEANQIIVRNYIIDFKNNTSHKFSSNVFEKCLQHCDFETKQMIIKSLCNYESVRSLLYDMYGNYVLQQTMVASNEPYRTMYIQLVAPLLDGLRVLPFGNIVIHKLMTNFPEIMNYININRNNYYQKMNNMGMGFNNMNNMNYMNMNQINMRFNNQNMK